jgi:hypothetical protein
VVSSLAKTIDANCLAFYYSPVFPRNTPFLPPAYKLHIDAVWASTESGIPTINGYSGHAPRGWSGLSENEIVDELSFGYLRDSLLGWITTHGLDPGRVCWIGPPASRAALAP